MSIFANIFGPAPVAAAPAPQQGQQTNPGNIPTNAGPALASAASAGTAPNGTVPASAAATEGAAKSGLDAFADIWNTEANPDAQGQPLFNVSHDKMMEAARKQNFGINPSQEQMAAIVAGGQGAAEAMMQLMNTVAQNVYAQSAFASTRLIEGALDKSKFAKEADLERTIKNSNLSDSLRQENPLFNHPAAKPLLESVRNQLLVKYPQASSQELAEMAKTYLSEFATAASAPALQKTKAAATNASEDWERFFN